MRKIKKVNWGWSFLAVVSSMVLMLLIGILVEPFSIVSNAQSQGKVVVESAKIRQDASTSSEALGSATKDDSLTINHQVTGSDGKIWYQVFVDADTLGYIRSDLVKITDGTTPPTVSGTASNTTDVETTNSQPVNTNENLAEVTAVEPLSASVTGSQSVRVRSNASTGSQIVTMAQSGLALTVTGQAEGTDGKVWYRVSFISDGAEVTGFIRSDYVALSGELLPVTNETPAPPVEETPQEPVIEEEPEEIKDWDTEYDDGKWYLNDNINANRYDIDGIFETVKENVAAIEASEAKTKSQQGWIILLVALVILMAGAIAFLVFKIKDMIDSAYFAEVEKETVRRRTADRPVNSDRKVMHTVGAERRSTGVSAQEGQRPVGARPVGTPVQGGQRPAGARPVGTPAQRGQRPAGARPVGVPAQGGQRPAGARPVGTPAQGGQRPAGARPVGTPAQGGQRLAGARPVGAPAQGGQRPVEARPAETPAQGERPVGERTAGTFEENGVGQNNHQPMTQRPQHDNAQNSGWKSKNFMADDDDEFEFEFLNWDGEDDE